MSRYALPVGPVVTLVVALVVALGSHAAPAGIDTLWDNGLGFDDGVSHGTPEGMRRSVLDDFTIEVAEGWAITGAQIVFVWGVNGDAGIGEDLEVAFFADDDGRPDFDTRLAQSTTTSFLEVNRDDPCQILWCIIDMSVSFEPIVLPPGTYWVEFRAVSGRPDDYPLGYQLLSDTLTGAPAWVHREDMGGPMPIRDILGEDRDVNFLLFGTTREACPADLDGNGDVGFADVLSVLAAWGNAGGLEDLDGSGAVDFGDILLVLSVWGPCV